MNLKCGCGAIYDVPAALSGKTIRCQKCGRQLAVPTVQPAAGPKPEVTVPIDPQATIAQSAKRPGPTEPKQPSTWVAGPAPISDPKTRKEKEEQLVAQYLPYQPAPGTPLRGAQLNRAIRIQRRRAARMVGWRYFGIGMGLTAGAIAGFFALAEVDSGDRRRVKVHWLMAILYSIGGKWAAAIGLGVFALICIVVAVLYWVGVLGQREK
jgi:hypothetical protein